MIPQQSHPKIMPKPPPYIYLSKIIQTKQPKLDPIIATEIAKAVHKYSIKYQLPPELIIAVIERESTFRSTLVSNANCKGLMQINVKFHQEKLKKLNIKGNEIHHISNNIHIGCMILREYYDSTGTISEALTKYVGGSQKGYIKGIVFSFTDLIIKKHENKLK
ncbi:MAG: transglycosylase SLT domain-containing protein [Gammaproteobacteria bacterium]|nr:transglycosylase SLT domain-containing protein [Gammaproteobacteria bacterium]